MVERHKNGDPVPEDPRILRLLVKHPVRAGTAYGVVVAVLIVTFALLFALFVQFLVDLRTEKRQQDFLACVQVEKSVAKKTVALEYASSFVDTQASYEAASTCCLKLKRIPVTSEGNVVCFAPQYADMIYRR